MYDNILVMARFIILSEIRYASETNKKKYLIWWFQKLLYLQATHPKNLWCDPQFGFLSF
jgi:hypothetical protein